MNTRQFLMQRRRLYAETQRKFKVIPESAEKRALWFSEGSKRCSKLKESRPLRFNSTSLGSTEHRSYHTSLPSM